ncbi:MAG: hypothetical protein AAFO95_02865 [Cyanobacteria bacterium J06600_6]
MFNSEDDINQDLTRNRSSNNSDSNLDQIDANVSTESIALRKKQLESIFTKLIIFGLTLGTILGLTAYYLLHRFGMTKKPYQLEQERIEREQEAKPNVDKINNFSPSNSSQDRFEI